MEPITLLSLLFLPLGLAFGVTLHRRYPRKLAILCFMTLLTASGLLTFS
jgi:hypothetical protein